MQVAVEEHMPGALPGQEDTPAEHKAVSAAEEGGQLQSVVAGDGPDVERNQVDGEAEIHQIHSLVTHDLE